jgi:hypothetical protein
MISIQNVAVYDDAGIPSFMVRFKKEKNKDLFPGGSDTTHPAFIIGGEEVDEIYISQYANTIFNGKAYSWPLQRPAVNLTYEEAMSACFAKGEGWHMITAAEYALAILDSKRKNTLPHGNTYYGKDWNHREEKGIIFDDCFTLTGSGPATWAHDHTMFGIHDLNGNIWEMTAGLRLMNGVIEVIPDNNAAAPHDYGKQSNLWQPILHNGDPLKFKTEDGIVKLTTGEVEQGWDGCRWCDAESEIEVPEIVKALSLFPTDEKDGQAYIFVDTDNGRMPFRGGRYSGASYAGLGSLNLYYARSNSSGSVGFRSAFYRKTEN